MQDAGGAGRCGNIKVLGSVDVSDAFVLVLDGM